MSLDLFQTDNRDAINNAERGSAPLLPATYKESFDAAWDNAVLFGQSFAGVNARHRAMHDVLQEAYTKTGDERFRRDSPQYEGRFNNPTAGSKDMVDIYNGIVADRAKEGAEREASGYPASTLAPITAEQLDVRAADISKDARDAYRVMSARQKTAGGSAGFFLGGAGGTVVDPINLLTFPLAAPEALGILKTGAAWAGIGAGTQTAIEAVGAPFREQVEPGYAQSNEPLANIAGAGVFAGGFGSTIKALGTGWRWYKGKAEAPRTLRDAGNVLDSEVQISETNPLRGPEGEVAHRAALSKTFDDVIKGDAPNVDSIITPEMMDGYTSRLTPVMKARQAAIDAGNEASFLAREDARLPGTMERLSEMQLGEIRGAVDALDTGLVERQAALTAQLEKARTAHAAQLGKVEQAKPLIENLQRLEKEIADQTEAKNQAVERSGSDSPEATAAFDRLDALRREHAAENNKLKKAQAGTAKLEKLAQTVQEREAALPLRQVTAEARAATRKGRATGEMSKAIGKLAEDGYGLKLDPAEIASLADNILKAPADSVEAVLRDTTEHLVDKARAQRALAPPTPFGAARPHEEQAAHALRITNVMRMRVQTLAREVGYAMPKEEAGAIAARLLEVKEPDALAILDELVLRPRTIAKTMAEPRPTVPEGIPTPPAAEAPKAPAQPAGFTTAKGSTYELHPDGTTTRNKAARSDVGHEGDSGMKSRTERTVYVDDASLASALSAAGVQNLGSKGARVIIDDGKASLLTWNEAAGRWGRSPLSTDIKISDTPAVGKAPLELWKRADDVPGHEAYRGMHAGNAITEVRGEPAVEPPPSATVPPAYERAAAEQMLPKNVEKLKTDPEMTATVERDLQRMRAETPDKEIPVGIDKDGAPITRTVEEAATDIEQRQQLAEEIRASCGPQPDAEGDGTATPEPAPARAEPLVAPPPGRMSAPQAALERPAIVEPPPAVVSPAPPRPLEGSGRGLPASTEPPPSTGLGLSAGAAAGGGGLLASALGGDVAREQTRTTTIAAPPATSFPTEEEAALAQQQGLGYGSAAEAHIAQQVARVLGTTDKAGVFSPQSGEGQTLDKLTSAATDDARSKNIDLTKPEYAGIREQLGNVFARTALAVNRIPIAALGFDPSRAGLDVEIAGEGIRVNIGGAYGPKHDAIYANLADASTLTHEFIHRGVEMLRGRAAESKDKDLQSALRALPDEENVVRYLMAKQAGDPDKDGGQIDKQQRAQALALIDGNPRYQAAIATVTAAAQQEMKRNKPRGPR